MDQLSTVLSHFSISAGVFYTGKLCGVARFETVNAQTGHLHLLKQGKLRITGPAKDVSHLDQPSLVFFPRPQKHRLIADETAGADIVCASVGFGTHGDNPLANALPAVLVIPLAELPGLQTNVECLFSEAFDQLPGRQAMMDRLAEILIIQLLRFVIQRGLVNGGMLAGLAEPRLAKCIKAMHEEPHKSWPLAELAAIAAMSRSTFADRFRRVVGQPPGDYLIEWRVGVAQGLLKRGQPVNLVAHQVGYENASAFARVFRKKVGTSPMQWLGATQRQNGERSS